MTIAIVISILFAAFVLIAIGGSLMWAILSSRAQLTQSEAALVPAFRLARRRRRQRATWRGAMGGQPLGTH